MLSLWIASSLTSRNIDSAPLAIVPMFIHYWVGFRASQENWMEFGMKPREQGERRGGTWNVLQYDASRMALFAALFGNLFQHLDRKSTRLNSSHANISYAVFCLKKKKKIKCES